MNLSDMDALATQLQRVGQSGALPKTGSVPQLVDELQRQLGVVGDVLRLLLEEARERPGTSKDALLFLIDARPTASTYNVLSTAQAGQEGLGATAGLAVFRHGQSTRLDRATEVFYALANRNIAVANGQTTRSGRAVMYGFDDNRTVFQLDIEAETQQAIAIMAVYASQKRPSAKITKDGQTTGAAVPQLGFVLASSVSRDIP